AADIVRSVSVVLPGERDVSRNIMRGDECNHILGARRQQLGEHPLASGERAFAVHLLGDDMVRRLAYRYHLLRLHVEKLDGQRDGGLSSDGVVIVDADAESV